MPDEHANSAPHGGPCGECVSRRDFVARGTLALAGVAAIAACGNGQFGPVAVQVPEGQYSLKVSTLPDLAITGQLVVPPGNQFVAIKRTGSLTFVALSIVCTHQGCLTQLRSNALVCPCHDSQFDANGAVTQQPVGGGTATALRRLATLYDPNSDTLTIG